MRNFEKGDPLEESETTKLERFNRVFQWTGFRLCRVMWDDALPSWAIMGPVLPMSGWGSVWYIGWFKIYHLPGWIRPRPKPW